MSEFNETSNDIRVLTVKFCGVGRYKEFKLSGKEYNEFKSEWQKFKGLMSWVTFHPVGFKDLVSINLSHIEMVIWDERPDDPKATCKVDVARIDTLKTGIVNCEQTERGTTYER